MRITSKGQVTIPIDIRERAGLLPQTEVEWVIEDGKVVLRPATDRLEEVRRKIRSVRGTGTDNLDMTTDELMEMLRGPWEDLPEERPSLNEKPGTFRHG